MKNTHLKLKPATLQRFIVVPTHLAMEVPRGRGQQQLPLGTAAHFGAAERHLERFAKKWMENHGKARWLDVF